MKALEWANHRVNDSSQRAALHGTGRPSWYVQRRRATPQRPLRFDAGVAAGDGPHPRAPPGDRRRHPPPPQDRPRSFDGLPSSPGDELAAARDDLRVPLHGALQPHGQPERLRRDLVRRRADDDQRRLRHHLRRRNRHLRDQLRRQRPAHRPHRRQARHPHRRGRLDADERGDGRRHDRRSGGPERRLGQESHSDLLGALRRQHVLPELWRRRDRQEQRPLVPRPRARRLRRHLRCAHLTRHLLRVRLGLRDPRSLGAQRGLLRPRRAHGDLLGDRLLRREEHAG